MSEEIRNLLEGLPFWKHLKEEEKRQLEEASREVHYPAGAGVYSGAGECLGAIYILNGIFRTYLLSDEGKEVTMFRLRQGDTCILSASCVLPAITFDVEIEAQTEVDAVLIPARVLVSLTRDNIYVENYVYKEAAKRFSDVVEALQQMMFLSLTQRIAAFLLDESAKTHSPVIAMTQEDLAKQIGSAREAVSRILKQMVKKGYVTLSRGEVKIENKEELYRLL